jgi:hypothetical protein
MDEQSATADLHAQLSCSGDDIRKESRSEPSALVSEIDAQPSEQGDRLRVTAGTLA